ncbi:hypothetical protein [Aporhodopirellula aestuarii]|uniref:Uncharacterized protein n=1 Tax=Aporhodopirellula aestuarii TaxID=2950107 RepID=A0ABT0TXP9_9BACT|nr:hypothetical protein [Aporhodopirellula aestuarii]MCM2369377.1 hypothetical protein [Aporhodopirellula aestuarii]
MTPNPYEHPRVALEASDITQVCVRRLDIAAIASSLCVLFLVSLAATAVPSVRLWFMPRFGWTAGLALFPANFLLLYLWRPSPRLLASATMMFFATAAINAAKIAWIGTVPVVSNAFTDRLPSAYFWSVFLFVAIGVYVGWVAWTTRHHVAVLPERGDDSSQP